MSNAYLNSTPASVDAKFQNVSLRRQFEFFTLYMLHTNFIPHSLPASLADHSQAYFPFHLIDAMGTQPETQQAITTELHYQSEHDLR